jgi:hypothetical protein
MNRTNAEAFDWAAADTVTLPASTEAISFSSPLSCTYRRLRTAGKLITKRF